MPRYSMTAEIHVVADTPDEARDFALNLADATGLGDGPRLSIGLETPITEDDADLLTDRPEGLHLTVTPLGSLVIADAQDIGWVRFGPGGTGDPHRWFTNIARMTCSALNVTETHTDSDELTVCELLDRYRDEWLQTHDQHVRDYEALVEAAHQVVSIASPEHGYIYGAIEELGDLLPPLPGDEDTASSASRQHYIDTGHYLRHDGTCLCDDDADA